MNTAISTKEMVGCHFFSLKNSARFTSNLANLTCFSPFSCGFILKIIVDCGSYDL